MSKTFKRRINKFFLILMAIGLILLTLCSTLVIGLLSFGGMYALTPIIWLAAGAFILAVLYEGQIYYKNTKETAHKLITKNYLKKKISADSLKNAIKNIKKLPEDKKKALPEFFKMYISQKEYLGSFKHKKLTASQKKEKKRAKQQFKDMEKYFANVLMAEGITNTTFEQELTTWLDKNNQKTEAIALYNRTRIWFFLIKIFTIFSAIAMGFGTLYLLYAEFTAIPFLMMIPLSFLPGIIIPLAIIAGIGYSFLIYNALTEMILHKTIRTSLKKLWNDLKNGRIVLPAITAILVILTIVMTICTAGTWWYIIKLTPPLWTALTKIPTIILGLGNVIVFISNLLFDLQNIDTTLEEMSHLSHAWETIKMAFSYAFKQCKEKENPLQWINPFRVLLKMTLLPLRLICFALHLLSIAVTGDRIASLGVVLSFLICLITELFIDWHYIMELHQLLDLGTHDHTGHGHDHGHAHDHHNDIPSLLLKCLCIPLYGLSTLWDYGFSLLNEKETQLTLTETWHKQWGGGIPSAVKDEYEASSPPTVHSWNIEYVTVKTLKFDKKYIAPQKLGQTLNISIDTTEEELKQNLTPQEKKTGSGFFSTHQTELLGKLYDRITPAMGA